MKKKKAMLLIAGVMLFVCIGGDCERSSREEAWRTEYSGLV